MDFTLDWAVNTDVTVRNLVTQNCSLEMIVIQLVKDKEQMVKRIIELEGIAPRKIRLSDGRVMVWRCPTDLVPDITVTLDRGK
uniref:Uncharacterized protein n=1 Tax=viral metagenome TaxID=1070528 RepID=A0A6M3ILD6_9ZZZZ